MTTLNTQRKKRIITDVHEPNAGTDFHMLWCIDRALSLLNFHENGLTLIGVENLTPKDQVEVDPDGDKLLTVDLCEYYHGEEIATVSKVVISQLKYSTKHSQTEWTVAKICEGKKAAGKGSIIDRFASTFKALRGASHADKIEIKLISNRPAHNDLSELVNYAKDSLLNKDISQNVKSLEASLTRIGKIANLSGDELLTFVSRLNFDDCNSASRALLRSRNMEKISELGFQDSQNQLAILEGLVRRKSYPESKKNNTINRNDVLLELGVTTYESIFPVKNHFKEGKIVNRVHVQEIYKAIDTYDSIYPFCVHGAAGIGKTTFLQQIREVDTENTFIFFDCYGGGAYLDPEDLRHKHKYALLTLSNELARNIGSALLLVRNENEDFYVKEFVKRVREASRILQETRPKKRIYICVDAADNSILAADRSGDKNFITDLIRIKYPDNVKVIITTRTFRKDFLKINEEILYFELKPFTRQETGLFLALRNMSGSIAEVEELHRLTGGIPRVLSYTLELSAETLSARMEPLRPDGKDMQSIFKSITTQAALRAGNKEQLKKIVKLLVTLPRPIPLSFVNEIMGTDEAYCNDVLIDLSSGIKKSGDYIHFIDEDFEAFLEDWSKSVEIDYESISNILLKSAEKDEYASTHLGFYLELSSRHEELRQIVLERKFLNKPEDHYKNVKVFLSRAKIAMKYAASAKDLTVYTKLQTITAEATSSNHILEKLLLDNAELEAIFIYDPTMDRRHSAEIPIEYLGSYYLRTAAVLSRNQESKEAAKALFSLGNSWINKWKSASSPENDYKLDENDISYGIEASLRLFGFDKAVEWSYQWNPRSVVFERIYNTVIRILSNSDKSDIETWGKDINLLRTDVKIEVLRAFRDAGISIEINIIEDVRLLKRLATILKNRNLHLSKSFGFVIEQLLGEKTQIEMVRELVSLLNISCPDRIPSFSGYNFDIQNEENLMTFVRYHSFICYLEHSTIKTEDLLPCENVKGEDEKNKNRSNVSSEDHQKLKQFYDIVFPIFKFRLSAIMNKKDKENLLDELDTLLSMISYPYDFPNRFGNQYNITLIIFEELFGLMLVLRNRKSFFEILKRQGLRLSSNKTKLLLYLANKAVVLKEPEIITELLSEANQEEATKIKPGSEMISFYQEATVIANSVSYSLSKHYFDKLIEATQEIDIEAFDRIRILSAVATFEKKSNWEAAWKFSKYVEYCALKLKGYEDFPWSSAIEGIAKIDAFTLLPILSNWDHRSVYRINDALLSGLAHLLDQEVLSKESVAALITCQNVYWNGYCQILDRLLMQYLKDANLTKRRQFLDFIVMDYNFEMDNSQQQRLLPEILLVLTKHNLQDTKSVRAMMEYERWMKKDNHQNDNGSPVSSNMNELVNSEILLDVQNRECFENYLRKVKNDDYRYFSDYEMSEILTKIKSLGKEGFKNAIEVLLSIDNNLIPFYFFSEILEESISLWITHTDIKEWVKDHFSCLLAAQNGGYLRIRDYERPEQLNRLKQICQISDEHFQNILLEVVPSLLENLTGVELYRLLELTTSGMDSLQRSSFTNWLIELWDSKIKTDFGDNNFPGALIERTEENLLIGFYRYLLGHPDKRLRWRTARSLFRITSMGNTSLVGKLILNQNIQTCQPFTDSNEPFYWLASKTWLWVVLHKISSQNPVILLEWIDRIKEELLTPILAHAQILWFVKGTCLNLEQGFPGTFTQPELDTLNKIFEGVQRKRKEKKSNNIRDSKTRFKFNYLDTVEYWYKGLGRCFDIPASEVATVVDNILIDDWLIPAVLPNVNNTSGFNGDLTWHRKFERPVVEPYQTYLEYHGMQCAAMELLKKYPLKEDGDDWGTWPYWIIEQGLLWDEYWLSDLKDPVPMEKDFWKPKTINKDWEYEIAFEQLLNLPQYGGLKNDVKTFILKEYSTIHWGKNYESRTISSALVRTKNAQSALLTVQTLDGAFFHHFQSEESLEGRDEEEIFYKRSAGHSTDIRSEGFHFFPTTKTLDPERNSIDEFDPSIRGMYKQRWILGSVFTKNREILVSQDKRIAYQKDNLEEPISIFENWSNTPEREGHGQNYSTGIRLYIKEEWLLDFLKTYDLSLLLQTEIYRYQEKNKSNHEHKEYALYHLIQSDGTIRTLSGDFNIGQKTDSAL